MWSKIVSNSNSSFILHYTTFPSGNRKMSFQELCDNGTFLQEHEKSNAEGFVALFPFYKNQLSQVQRTSLGILFSFLSLVAIIGNGLALLTVYKRKLQILYKCCVVSQSFSDLLMAVFVGINSLNNFIHDTIEWRFGAFMCGWMPCVTTMCALLSSMIITCIAIDRYQGVILLSGKWESKFFTAFILIVCLWLVAAGTTVPTFLSYKLIPACFIDQEANTSYYAHLCLSNKTINSQYFITIFALIFLPLLIAFIVLNVSIARVIWEKKKQMVAKQNGSTSTIDTSLDSHSGPDAHAAHKTPTKSSNEKKKVRTFTIILIIMGTFIVCRLPQWIFIVATSFPKYRVTGNFWWTFKYLLSALSLANTAINPFIYPFLNDLVNLKSNITTGLKNLRNFKLRNIRMNLVSSTGK